MSFDDAVDVCRYGVTMVLGEMIGDSFSHVASLCLVALLLEESQLSETLLDVDIFRREADEDFRRFKRSSGFPLMND
jgi:hypothetical protein